MNESQPMFAGEEERRRSGTFQCPICYSTDTVSASQARRGANKSDGMPFVFRRGRRCLACAATWNTYELVEVGSVRDANGRVLK